MATATVALEGVRERVSAEEWQQRVNLAACYRKIALLGWDDLIFTHISARVPDRGGEAGDLHFLLNPYGLMFGEVTASSLVKVDLSGKKVLDSPYDINPAGFTIHSAVHEARPDAHCVLHLHTVAGVAVSCQKGGLLPISQFSLFPLSSLSYHGYEGLALNPDEKGRLQADLGSTSFMILRNHGLLTCGTTVAEAFLRMFVLQRACEVQVMAQAGGGELIPVAQPILAGIQAQFQVVLRGIGAEQAWPGVLRSLDRIDPSYRE